LTFDGQILTRRQLPIGVDPWLAESEPKARGGCSIAPDATGLSAWWLAAALALLRLRRR
jgi:MYXO-CTERM domain-containing protein